MKYTTYIIIFCLCFGVYGQNNDNNKIQYHNDSLYTSALKKKNDSLLNKILASYVKGYYTKKDSSSFYKCAKEHIKLATKLQDTSSLTSTIKKIATFYRRNNKIDSAYCYYLKNLKLYTAINDSLNISFTLTNLGIIQKNLRDYPNSIHKLKKAFRYIKNKNKPRATASVFDALANNYQLLKEYDSALVYHHKAIEIRKTLKNSIYYVKSLNNIGLTYKKQHRYSEAVNYFNKGLKNPKVITINPSLYAKLLDNKTHALFLQNRDNKELEINFIKALSIRDSINDAYGKVMSYMHLAELYKHTKDKEKATYYIHYADTLAKTIHNHQDRINILEQQVLLFEGEAKEKAMANYTSIRNSLDFADKKRLSKFYDIEEEIDKANLTISKEREGNKNKHNTIITLFFLIIILSAIYFVSLKKKRKKELGLLKVIESIKDVQNEVFCSSDFSLNEENKKQFQELLKKKLDVKDIHIEFWEYQSQGLLETEIVKKLAEEKMTIVTIDAVKGRRKKLYKKLRDYYNLDEIDKVKSIEIYRRELKKFGDTLSKI
ncbi:protein of unknown function [Tenacibaculum sp. 190524A02b]|uniref:tetratricopeptide repeat protein n=1 Tax=Tenacibaculum vairaonense TaxID=3137860 RepID=UPI0032B1274F